MKRSADFPHVRSSSAILPLFALSLAWPGTLAAQTAGTAGHSGHVHTQAALAAPAGMIDGALHPELISDQEAITVLWISLMEPSGAGADAQARFAAKTRKINLPPADSAILWAAAQNFYSQFMPLRQQAQQLADAAAGKRPTADLPSAIAQQRGDVAAAIDRLALTTQSAALASLSPRAAAALKAHLADFKAHMKIIPPPQM